MKLNFCTLFFHTRKANSFHRLYKHHRFFPPPRPLSPTHINTCFRPSGGARGAAERSPVSERRRRPPYGHPCGCSYMYVPPSLYAKFTQIISPTVCHHSPVGTKKNE